MTWITDNTGRYWVDETPRKRRKPARALRFGDLKPGAILIHRGKITSTRFEHADRLQPSPAVRLFKGKGLAFANDDALEVKEVTHYVGLALCTDRWFDPVLGEDDPIKGRLAAVIAVTNNGLAHGKRSHTLRGLATQGYHPTSEAQAERVRAFIEERETLKAEWTAGTLTQEEARLRSTPWRGLLRELGLGE